MIDLSSIKGVYLYTGLTDRRSGIKRLSIKVASDFQRRQDRMLVPFLWKEQEVIESIRVYRRWSMALSKETRCQYL